MLLCIVYVLDSVYRFNIQTTKHFYFYVRLSKTELQKIVSFLYLGLYRIPIYFTHISKVNVISLFILYTQLFSHISNINDWVLRSERKSSLIFVNLQSNGLILVFPHCKHDQNFCNRQIIIFFPADFYQRS